MHSITIIRIKKTNIALNVERDSCERFFGDGHIRMVFAIYVYVDVGVVRGVRFGFPFPETRNPGREIYCGFQVPRNGNPGFRKSGTRNPSGFPILRNS
jgi:hypothetical protein